jgi:hypothetical protein
MQLHDRVLEGLAEIVVGDNHEFPYRSSYYIAKFFQQCDLPFTHDGSTRAGGRALIPKKRSV